MLPTAFASDDRRNGISWVVDFETSGEWQAIELDLSSFKTVFRGRTVLNAGPVNADSILQAGLSGATGA
jgi:hypothetical protein